MSDIILISDANILIDMEVSDLLEHMFNLDFNFATTDFILHDELSANYSQLVDMGLKTIGLSDQFVSDLARYRSIYKSVGFYDLSAMVLAQQENAPLLTGDRKLRNICDRENVIVHGTLWLTENMLQSGVTNVETIKDAYDKMKEEGSRLPWDEVEKQITKYSSQ